MLKNKTIHKDYNQVINTNNKLSIKILEEIILHNDSVRILSQVMEELNYEKLMKAYSPKGRNPVVSPKVLFKILVYAYMNNIYSSRKIEIACRRDINFMWLLQGEKVPDHNTISRFRSKRISVAGEDLFYQLIEKLLKLKEIKFENIFIDGTKIEANANKYTFVWKKSTDKSEVKLQEKLRMLIRTLNDELNINYTIYTVQDKITVQQISEILTTLNKMKISESVEFVHGKGKRKSKLQRFIEQFDELTHRQGKYDNYNSIFDGRNSFSKTDKDATFMHMKEDHMRNAQLKPGYNVQIGVEGEYIVGLDISSERSDQLTLIPFLKNLKLKLHKTYKNVVADAGYESEENYVYLLENNHNSFIKPQNYESRKKKKFKNNISKRENMHYDEQNDCYICYNRKVLMPIGKKSRKSKSGYKSILTIYECEDCNGCEYKDKCTKSKGNRQIHISKKFIDLRENSLANINSAEGILLRMNRSIQVEGTFGVLKENYGFRQFLTRGKENVKCEFLLLSFAFNINKLHTKMRKNKLGVSFFIKDIA